MLVNIRMAAAVVQQLLVILVIILSEWSWPFCGSREIGMSYKLCMSKSPRASVCRWDRSLENVDLKWRMGAAAAAQDFNLAFGSGLSIKDFSSNGNRRMVLGTAEKVSQITTRGEVEVLTTFKNGITSDPLNALSNWLPNDSDACSWVGVGCSRNTKHVTELNLTGLQLEGTVSTLLGQLSFLQLLDLSDNLLEGAIPPSISNCSDLLFLNISGNGMSGRIPHQVGQLENLQTLDLSSNDLGGEIPGALGNLSSLEYLDLGMNTFEGGVPAQLGLLSRLQHLSLQNTSLSGTIPSALGNCSSLTLLWISDNPRLEGVLPDLKGLTNLMSFSFSSCNFVGTFPTWISNLTALQYLNLARNRFVGPIPESLGQLLDMKSLNLGSNVFSGEIPSSIVNMSALFGIRFDQNQMTGTIPPDIGLLRNIQYFYLFSNAITGLLPSSLSNCSSMQRFMVGDNPFDPQPFPSWIESFRNLTSLYAPTMHIHGEIPPGLGQLQQLEELMLWQNNMTGVIPAALGNCSFLYDLDVRANVLTGELPPELQQLPLLYLQVGQNYFNPAPFPAFLFNITTLLQLSLFQTQYNGTLDGDFGRLSQLSLLEISSNFFEGTIPESLSNCTNLEILDLGGNYMVGGIPPGLGNLTYLSTLWLEDNYFNGSLPTELMMLSQLTELLLSINELRGAIPENIGWLSSIERLYLDENNFTGVLPPSLGNCTQMLLFDASRNRLTGSIPGAILAGMSAALTSLDLSSNSFNGRLPSQLQQLTNIQLLNVSANNLSGPIPPGLKACVALQILDLSFNGFTGELPGDLVQLKHLSEFNVSYNNLSGPIPDSGFFESSNFTEDSLLGNPGLCGGILGPQQQCPVAAAPQTIGSGSSSDCDGFKCTRVWASVVGSVGFVLLLIATASCVITFRHRAKGLNKLRHKVLAYPVDPRVRLTEADILATVAAGQENIIGAGAKSTVYKAILPTGETVAIKVLRDPGNDELEGEDEEPWEKEIWSEAHTLAKLRHRNVIKVLGLFSTSDKKTIVLEYMPKGSLHAHLHECPQCELTWEERFKILLGVAHGMAYLHHDFPEAVIHRDLKPSNILLNADMEPKVCDFGISKFVARERGEVTASGFCGTFGYMPPEYGTGAKVSTKGDVYSYGVVLLELLTAKPVTGNNHSTHTFSTQTDGSTSYGQSGDLVSLVEQCFHESERLAFQLFDPTLRKEGMSNSKTKEKMMLTMRVGLLCTRENPQNRPSMNDVRGMLLEIQDVGQISTAPKTVEDLLSAEDPPSMESIPLTLHSHESL